MQQTEDKNIEHRTSNSDPGVISLLDYLEIIAKRWRMIAKVTVAAAVISVAYSLTLPNIYKSTALILPPQQDQGLMSMMLGSMGGGMANIAGDLFGKGTAADLYIGMLKSETIGDAIIEHFKLKELYEIKRRSSALKLLNGKTEIKAGKKDSIISISVEDKDPKLAADIANAYVDELGRLTVGLGISGAKQNRAYLEPRLTQAKVDLAKAEDNLKTFQLKNKAISVPDQAKASIEGVAMLSAQLAVQEVQLSALLSQFTNSTQEVQNTKATISNIKGQIARLEGTHKGGSIPSVGSVPDLGQEFMRLTREFKIQETLVELLTKQFEMTKLAEVKDVTGVQVIQKAVPSDIKAKPKRAIKVIMATFMACLTAVVWSLLSHRRQQMTVEEVQRWRHLKDIILNRA